MNVRKKTILSAAIVLLAVVVFLVTRGNRPSGNEVANAAPTRIERPESSDEMTMTDVLDMAQAARDQMSRSLDDYTARFVKREVEANGKLGEETEIQMKVQTRLRGDTEEAPLRVYLHFQKPESVRGREVIWAEDLYDGKMAVHEVGLLLSLKTIWLDPNGLLAMQGQRYPISEIGIVRLVEKLILRGERDRNDPSVNVTLDTDHQFGSLKAHLIQVRREKSTGGEDDYSLAEIVFDPERQLILSYRSFGWPQEPGGEPPLLESYAYYDLETNVGLTDADFDPKNPDYSFPAF